jgi:hypothetical protein
MNLGLIIFIIIYLIVGIVLILHAEGIIGKQPENFLGKFFSAYVGISFINAGFKLILDNYYKKL